MVGWHHSINGHEFEQSLGDGEGQGSLACCRLMGSQRVGHGLATEQQQQFINLVVLDLRCCVRAFFSCGEWGLLYLWWILLLQSIGSRCVGFGSCGFQLWNSGSGYGKWV